MLSSNISTFLNCIMTMSQIAENDDTVDEVVYDKFLFPIRISSIGIYLTLANFRDYDLFL